MSQSFPHHVLPPQFLRRPCSFPAPKRARGRCLARLSTIQAASRKASNPSQTSRPLHLYSLLLRTVLPSTPSSLLFPWTFHFPHPAIFLVLPSRLVSHILPPSRIRSPSSLSHSRIQSPAPSVVFAVLSFVLSLCSWGFWRCRFSSRPEEVRWRCEFDVNLSLIRPPSFSRTPHFISLSPAVPLYRHVLLRKRFTKGETEGRREAEEKVEIKAKGVLKEMHEGELRQR